MIAQMIKNELVFAKPGGFQAGSAKNVQCLVA